MVTDKDILASQRLIVTLFRSFRPRLLTLYGTVNYSVKEDASPVTELDVEIERSVKKQLLAQFPGFGFRGEETSAIASKNGATWFIDPIDSTSSFIHGLPYCSNMAALVVNDVVVASVIYHFASNELYVAQKGKGAKKNGRPIQVNDAPLSNTFVFANSYAYKHLYKPMSDTGVKFFAPVGASGYFFTRLAEGLIQGVYYINSNSKQHDILPGALLATEAGAKLMTFGASPHEYTGKRFIAATPSLYAATETRLTDIWESL